MCGITMRSSADQATHMTSKKHLRGLRDRARRSVLVTGLGAPDLPLVLELFRDFVVATDEVEFIALQDDAGGPPEGEGEGEGQGAWQVVLQDVDEARQLTKLSPLAIGERTVTISLAVQPYFCSVCKLMVNSAAQLEEHFTGMRHRELAEQQQDGPGEREATAEPTDYPLDGEDENTPPRSPCCNADKAGPPEAEVDIPRSGLKTAGEVTLLLRSLLYTHHVTAPEQISPALFRLIYALFLSCWPYPFTSVRPKERFFRDFTTQAGSKWGQVPLETALAILRHMDRDWPFPLPAGALAWLEERARRYAGEGPSVLLSKTAFVQIRNLKWAAFQVVKRIREALVANEAAKPVLLHPMQPFSSVGTQGQPPIGVAQTQPCPPH
eukprot:EG_transcript_14507